MRDSAFLKFRDDGTGHDVGVVVEELLERGAFLREVADGFVGDEDRFENLGATETSVLFRGFAGLADDLEDVMDMVSDALDCTYGE